MSYLIFIVDAVTFYCMVVPSIWSQPVLAIILASFYFFFSSLVFYFGFKASLCDPTDESIALQRKCKELGLKFEKSSYKFCCDVCDAYVMSSSKHCGPCNRCTSGFDHHCYYLNNCIGDQNYHHFWRLIISLFFM